MIHIPMIVDGEYKLDLTCTDDRMVQGLVFKPNFRDDFTPDDVFKIQEDIVANYKDTYIADSKIEYTVPA
jgi:hypothetical protein